MCVNFLPVSQKGESYPHFYVTEDQFSLCLHRGGLPQLQSTLWWPWRWSKLFFRASSANYSTSRKIGLPKWNLGVLGMETKPVWWKEAVAVLSGGLSGLYPTYMCRHERGSQPSRGVLEGLPCFHHNYTQTVWQCGHSNWLYEVTFIFTFLYMGRILTRYKSSCLPSPFASVSPPAPWLALKVQLSYWGFIPESSLHLQC